MQILIVIGIWDVLWPDNQPKGVQYTRAILYAMPLYFSFRFIIKEKELLSMEYSRQQIKLGNILLIAYIIFNVGLMIICINLIP